MQVCAHSGMDETHWEEARPAAAARMRMESFMMDVGVKLERRID